MKEEKLELFNNLLELNGEAEDLIEEIEELREQCKIAIEG